jgi:hypothetical protein
VRRLRTALAVGLSALAVAGAALAADQTYAGPMQWPAGAGYGSSYSSGWVRNYFFKHASGFETTVTFIDNTSYAWHATVRNSSQSTHTTWWTSIVKRGHCRAHAGGFWGSCAVFS